MAYGIVKVIPASSHVDVSLTGGGGGSPYPSIKVLNPNDGVCYVAKDRDAKSVNYGDWDWKIPSQSYAGLPGPFSSAGVFYLDQSGAGRQGEVTIYPSQSRFDDPIFLSIGRALQAQSTSLDIVEGAQPANPGSGILRLWADGTDVLRAINGSGVDRQLIDTLRTLGGSLTGTLPNPGIAPGAATASVSGVWNVLTTTSATAPSQISGTSTIQLTTQGNPVLVCAACTMSNNTGGGLCGFAVTIDSTAYVIGVPSAPLAGYLVNLSGIAIPTLAAGLHSFFPSAYTGAGQSLTISNAGNVSLFVMELRR